MLARLHTSHNDRENRNEDLTAMAGGFRRCIVEFYRLFESFLKLAADAATIPVFLLHRVTHAILLLVTIQEALNSIADEKRQFIHVEELKTQLYLDGVVSLLRQVTTQRPIRSVIAFARLLIVLQNWIHQQSRGVCSPASPASCGSHDTRQRLQAEKVSTGQASLHPPDQEPCWTSGRSRGHASETYAHIGNVERTGGASASRNGSRYHGMDQSIMCADVRSALKMVLAEDDIATEYLGGFLELAEKSV